MSDALVFIIIATKDTVPYLGDCLGSIQSAHHDLIEKHFKNIT